MDCSPLRVGHGRTKATGAAFLLVALALAGCGGGSTPSTTATSAAQSEHGCTVVSRWLVLDVTMPVVFRPLRPLVTASFDKENVRTMAALKRYAEEHSSVSQRGGEGGEGGEGA